MTKRKMTDIKNFTVVIYRTALTSQCVGFLRSTRPVRLRLNPPDGVSVYERQKACLRRV